MCGQVTVTEIEPSAGSARAVRLDRYVARQGFHRYPGFICQAPASVGVNGGRHGVGHGV